MCNTISPNLKIIYRRKAPTKAKGNTIKKVTKLIMNITKTLKVSNEL